MGEATSYSVRLKSGFHGIHTGKGGRYAEQAPNSWRFYVITAHPQQDPNADYSLKQFLNTGDAGSTRSMQESMTLTNHSGSYLT